MSGSFTSGTAPSKRATDGREGATPEWVPLRALQYSPVPCPLCRVDDAAPWCEKQIRQVRMRYWRCRRCSCLYASPRATVASLENLYASADFFEGGTPGGDHLNYFGFLADEPYLRKTAKRRLRRIGRYCPTGRMLEVASAAGFFLVEAKSAGYDVSGVELSGPLAEYSSRRWGVPVVADSIERTDLADQAYDVIASWGVMTIIQDPLALIRKFHRALKPGGIWAFNTYYYDGIWPRLVGNRWDILTVNFSQIYTRELLLQIVGREGFRLLERRRDLPYSGLMKIADKLVQNFGLGWLPAAVRTLRLERVIVPVPLPDVLTYIWRKT